MSFGYKEKDLGDHQKVVLEETVAKAKDPAYTGPPPTSEPAIDRPEQHPTVSTLPMRPQTVIPFIDKIPSPPPPPGWEVIQHTDGAEAPPSLTTAPSVETIEQNKDVPEDEKSCDLTLSTMALFNKTQGQDVGAKASMKVKKGSATRSSDDSDEPMGPWAPGDGGVRLVALCSRRLDF